MNKSRTNWAMELLTKEQRNEIGKAVERNVNHLPHYLIADWISPCLPSKRFFIEASEHISIPYIQLIRESARMEQRIMDTLLSEMRKKKEDVGEVKTSK